MDQQTNITNIQILRAIAACYVVFFHAAMKLDTETIFSFYGQSGVDLFFIISGFVITYTTTYSTHPPSALSFIKKRIFRIIPLYWTLTIWLSATLLLAPDLFLSYSFSLRSLIDSLLFLPQDSKPVLPTGWTLNYEMYFYITFAIFILISKHPSLWVTSALCLCSLIGLTTNIQSIYSAFLTSELLIEFCFGVVICHGHARLKNISSVYLIGLVIIGASLFYLLREETRLFSFGIPWACWFTASVFASPLLRKQHWLIFLGDASYSIYLVHVISIDAIHKGFKLIGIPFTQHGYMCLLTYTALSILTGCILYLTYERPVHRWLRKLESGTGKSSRTIETKTLI